MMIFQILSLKCIHRNETFWLRTLSNRIRLFKLIFVQLFSHDQLSPVIYIFMYCIAECQIFGNPVYRSLGSKISGKSQEFILIIVFPKFSPSK